MSAETLIQSLSSAPVLGVNLEQVSVLRLDLHSSSAPGNKCFKLAPYLEAARRGGPRTLLSFGGTWSNHLHALAAVGRDNNLSTIGVIRGEPAETPSAMLADARRWGMQLEFVSRQDYRRRHDPHFIEELQDRLGPALVIPEGGASLDAVVGCEAIARYIDPAKFDRLYVATATGTTLAGLARALPKLPCCGVVVLKGMLTLDAEVAGYTSMRGRWSLEHDFHGGGYARVPEALREFILAFEEVQGVPLDPVYTGKLMFALWSKIKVGELSAHERVLAVHTGGLQGRRGYDWLRSPS